MSDTFHSYMEPIIRKEGGSKLTNDPKDRGGVTKWGVTEARARAAGYVQPMADMTLADALRIYELYFWRQPMFDQMEAVSVPVTKLMLDFGINFGPTVPSKFLQRALNVLNAEATLFPDVVVDGVCGAMTRHSLSTYLNHRGRRGAEVLEGMVRAQASVRYIEIAEGRETQERFMFGWQDKRAFGEA